MENYLFYAYLKWQKENKENTIYKLFKMPILAKILLVILFLTAILSFVFIFNNMLIASVINMLIESTCCIITFFYTERLQTKNCNDGFTKYEAYCFKLYAWINSFSISKEDEIIAIRKRIIKKAETLKSDDSKQKDKVEKWLQILVIPIVLAVVNNVINNQTDISLIITYVISILILFVTIYVVIYTVLAIKNVFSKKRINQYQCFANDLQGILDVKFGIN